MAISVLSQPQFHSEEAAFAFLEGVLWPEGPVCPHCGAVGRIRKIKANIEKRIRIGLHNQLVAPGVNDGERAERALAGIKGKRLTYRMPSWTAP
jgi:hypothetical protein